MRLFLIAVVFGVLGYVFLQQKQEQPPATPAKPIAQAASVAPTPAPTASTWPKRSIDRAREVAGQVSRERKDNQVP